MTKPMSLLNLSFLVYFRLTASGSASLQIQNINNINSQNGIFQCPQSQDCMIQCSSSSTCKNSIIQCPLNGNCFIECQGIESCADITINATHSESGIVNVLCEDSFTCRGMKVYGSKLDTNVDHFNLFCSGEYQSCGDAQVDCPVTGECNIECNGEDAACKNTTISGPVNGDLMVGCNGKRSCLQSTFDARYSFEFELTGCIETDSCLDLVVYCPENTNSTPNCLMQGNDNLGRYKNERGLQIYAVNGWKDVHIEYSGTYGAHYGGTMYCGYAYDNYCALAVDEWECANDTAFCNLIGVETKISSTVSLLDGDGDDYSDAEGDYGDLPNLDHKFEHGALGMILIGGGLIALAIGCVICGSIRKGYDAAKRKLSDMGFKSPFQRAKNYQPTASSHHVGQMMDDIEHSMDHSYSHHHHSHSHHHAYSQSAHHPSLQAHNHSHENHPGHSHHNGHHGHHGNNTKARAHGHGHGHGHHAEAHTASIHKNHSHSQKGTHTATINRPLSYHNQHGQGHGKTQNPHRAASHTHHGQSNGHRGGGVHHGHNGHRGGGGHDHHAPYRAVSHGHHGQSNGHHGHSRHGHYNAKRGDHGTEMVIIR